MVNIPSSDGCVMGMDLGPNLVIPMTDPWDDCIFTY